MPFHPVENFEVPAADGLAIRGDLYTPLDGSRSGLVILCHGFKGYRTWGFFPYLAACLADAGIAALAIDFSLGGDFGGDLGSGLGEDPGVDHGGAKRADLFRRNTISRERADLDAVLRPVVEGRLGSLIGARIPVGLFGHSRGGVVATLAACENDAIGALCTWSCPAHPDRFTAAQKEKWRRQGELDFTDSRSGAPLVLSTDYLDDLESHHAEYDLVRRVAALRVPHLIVHGEADLAVHVNDARALHDAEKELRDKRLLLLRTGHTFGVDDGPAMDPDSPPRALSEACLATVRWFARCFQKGH
jgi:dienelactone hydrolase